VTRVTFRHRVPFYETDAMGIVHHANYVRYLELARIAWMDEHDRPYREYVRDGLHFSTTRVDLRYLRSAGFDDLLDVSTWLDWVGGASLGMGYEIDRDGARIAEGITEHAMVDTSGKPRRIPADRRAALSALARTSDGVRMRRGTAARSR
jgi:acyl-CoA thioester hydrolase